MSLGAYLPFFGLTVAEVVVQLPRPLDSEFGSQFNCHCPMWPGHCPFVYSVSQPEP